MAKYNFAYKISEEAAEASNRDPRNYLSVACGSVSQAWALAYSELVKNGDNQYLDSIELEYIS